MCSLNFEHTDIISNAIAYRITRIYRYFSEFNYPTKFFTCENGVKIDAKKVCNGNYDCKWTRPTNMLDVSDEKCCKFLIVFESFERTNPIFNGTTLITSSFLLERAIFSPTVKNIEYQPFN